MTVTKFEARFGTLRIEAERGGEYLRFVDGHGNFVASIELKHSHTGPRIEVFTLDLLGRNTHEYLPTTASAQTVITALAKSLTRIWGQLGQYCEACKHVWSVSVIADTCPQCGDGDVDFLAF